MHIALVHNALIPPPKYGGTERAIFWLGRALLEKGHKVTLVAQEGSALAGAQFVPYSSEYLQRSAEGARSISGSNVDILHLWSTPSIEPQRPYVVTIEGNGQAGETFLPNTLFVSAKHAANHGSSHFVYNGLDLAEFDAEVGPSAPPRENLLVFLAKASWKVKNLKGAIAIARAAGWRLEVMGSRNWPLGLQRYLPPIGGVSYRGMVGDLEKRAVLKRAKALLFPVRWHEPFGIAITEALASGCAVMGTPYGSLPEIITQEVGCLSTSTQELVHALKNFQFKPEDCRARVNQGFNHHQMAEKYLSYYQAVLNCGYLTQSGPRVLPKALPAASDTDLLPWN